MDNFDLTKYNVKPNKKRGGKIVFFIILILIFAIFGYIYIKYGKYINGNSNTSKSISINNQYSLPGNLYFVKNKDLWRATDSHLNQITKINDITTANISPDGNNIVYSSKSLNFSDLKYATINGEAFKP